MKKSILFVEGELVALNTLKQALAGLSGTWDCTFVADAPAALAALAGQSFDAVLANLHLEGQSGAELLQEVGRKHPKTLRFIVGDVADQELIINCIGGAHQFIARPYSAHSLMAVVQRSLALDAWLSTEQLRALVPRLRRLPSLPSTYFEVLKQVESPSSSAQSIGEVIARDPVVTARLLQMVNSAALGLGQKITDPVEAVSLLGMETVKSLVLCLQVFSQNDQAKKAGISFDRLWTHSLTVADAARKLVNFEGGGSRMANDAFTAGLLHDVGRIVIASNLSEEYAAVIATARKHKRALHEEEAAQLGVSHAEVGAYLLSLWGMPAALVEAAALHHQPGHISTTELSLLTAVHVANVLAHEQDTHKDGLPKPAFDLAHLESLGLANKLDTWRSLLAGEKPARESKPVNKPVAAVAAPSANIVPLPSEQTWLPKLAWSAAAALALGALWYFNQQGAVAPLDVKARTVTESAAAAAEQEPVAPVVEVKAATPVVEFKPTPVLEPEPVVAKPVLPVVLPATGFSSVKIQGVFFSGASSTVIINGKTLGRGERINGMEVVDIGPSSVTLTLDGEQKVFSVK